MSIHNMYLSFLKENDLKRADLSYTDFSTVMNMHNIEVMKKIIVDGMQFNMGYSLGVIQGIEVKRKIKMSKEGFAYSSVNWVDSLKRKQRLIDEGKIPLEVYKNDKGKITGDNGGIKWLIYNLNDSQALFYWNRFKRQNNNNPDEIIYPLSLIKKYQIKFTVKNCKLLTKMHSDGVSYSKTGINDL